MTRYFYNNKNQFKCINLPFPIGDFSNIRVTLDNDDDYKLIKKMANYLDYGPNFMDTINILKNKFKILKKFSDSNIFYNAEKIYKQ